MKGIIVPVVIWSLACSPAVFAACRAPSRAYLRFAALVGALAIGLWIGAAGYGYQVTENMTSSLDGHIYLHRKGTPFARGDLVAYRWHGGATYPAGTIFIKQVVGMPGDRVTRVGNAFWVGGRYIGVAKTVSKAGVPLMPAADGVVPEDEYFLANPSPDSLDSRYALSGNVQRVAILGKAYELF